MRPPNFEAMGVMMPLGAGGLGAICPLLPLSVALMVGQIVVREKHILWKQYIVLAKGLVGITYGEQAFYASVEFVFVLLTKIDDRKR